jgi:uncharacterized membrane protein HdeD (DUF308 family)
MPATLRARRVERRHPDRVTIGHPRREHPARMDAATAVYEERAVAQAASWWWLFLVTGTLWILFSIVILRFDWTTVSSISILFGIAMIAAACAETFAAFASHGWWRFGRLVLAAALAVIGIVAFIHPGDTFAALAGVMSFAFVLKGTFDLLVGIVAPVGNRWVLILVGALELALGFWAAGDFGHRVVLLVVWVGVSALLRGVSEIVFAFTLRAARD